MTQPPPPPPATTSKQEERQLAMFIHLSVLVGMVVPVFGLVVPVAIWHFNRDRYPALTAHAYVVMNWIMSLLVYGLICLLLVLVLIGFLGFFFLGGLTILYALYGGIKASEGVLWEYPGSIRFLS